MLIAVGVFAVVAWMLGPTWIRIVQEQVSDDLRRRAAVIYLDGLLAGYALTMVASVAVIGGVVLMRVRSRVDTPVRRRKQARLLAIGVILLVSLMVLDAGARPGTIGGIEVSGFRKSIVRRPVTVRATRDRRSMAWYRSCRAGSHRSRPGLVPRPAPCGSSLSASPAVGASRTIPGCPSGNRCLETGVRIPGPADRPGYLGHGGGQRGPDAPSAGRLHLPSRHHDCLRRPQRVPIPIRLEAGPGISIILTSSPRPLARNVDGDSAVFAPLPIGAGDLGTAASQPATAQPGDARAG